MGIKEFRERVNLRLYNSKTRVLSLMSVLNGIVSLSAIITLVYFYGFPQTATTRDVCIGILEISFGFYILRYLVRIFYDFDPPAFIRKNWFESILVLALLIEGISYNVFGTLILEPIANSLGFKGFGDFSMIFIQLFVFLIILNNLFISGRKQVWLNIHPGWLFMISIAGLILLGTLLLMLPEMSSSKSGITFIDSLFLSASSVSCTGLSTIDLVSDVSFKGQVVVLLLIKLGGLNTIAFGGLMLIVAKFGVGVKYHEVIEDFMNKNSILDARSMLIKIALWSSLIELIGFIFIFIGFGSSGIFESTGERFYHAIFHSVSGFNNAGLSTLSNGMMHPDVIQNTFFQSSMLVLIFLGGFGMIYLFDLLEIKKLRERMRMPWKTIEFGTKISLYFNLWLVLIGALAFMVFEYASSLKGKSGLDMLVVSLFQSQTTRNAGFNVVDTAALSIPMLLVVIVLMFIGASSGSAGGGIRTSTLAILWASLISTVRGRKNVELFKRNITNENVMKAYTVLLFFIFGNIAGAFALTITEAEAIHSGQFDFLDMLFEQVSAASTVGLTTGVTTHLTYGGKIVIILAMFIGRVGTLTIAYLIGKKVISNNYKYPDGHTMIG